MGAQDGWEKLLQSHVQEWATIMTKDSVDDYTDANGAIPKTNLDLVESQITAVTTPFHILQNTIGANALTMAQNNTEIDTHSIMVGGLGSDSYAGLIFWDAEVWMAPGLVVSHPQAMKQVAKYRVKLFDQAQNNVKEAFTSSQNTTGKFSKGGAVFPWTSGRFGNCTGTGPCFDYEYHINGDIGLELYNYFVATGDSEYFRQELLPIYDAVAYFYGELVDLNKTTNTWDLHNATDPDEYANNVDNPGFTAALMQTHLMTANTLHDRFGLPRNQSWDMKAPNITVPIDANASILLEYSGMPGSIDVKQADVVLVDDFLQYQNPYSFSDLEYYAGKQTLNGPGMTYGVFSIVANAVSQSGCSSYTYDLYGSRPYTRAPWFQFSEQLNDNYTDNGGTHPAYPFLTGMGGAHRVAVFGYLGLRLRLDSFNIDPNLPPYIPQIKYRTIYWQGHPISASSNTTHTTLKRLPSSLENSNSTFNTQPIPVTIGFSDPVLLLDFNSTLVVPNRNISFNATDDGNIAQCRPATSSSETFPGQLPVGAVDGSITTKWQPIYDSSGSANLTVELGHMAKDIPVVGFTLNWAQNPPVGFQIYFSNTSDFQKAGVLVFSQGNSSQAVKISNPYDPTKVADITAYVGNTTEVKLSSSVPATQYACLVISGVQGDVKHPGDGATVADWAILREGGGREVPE
jgi:trehalose/maltose hydrolase-like predicted phosphorylase